MTLQTAARAALQAESYQRASVQSAEAYRARAIAAQQQQQAADDARAEAARATALPVIIDGPSSPVTVPGMVVIPRQQQPAPADPGTAVPAASAVVPLPQSSVDGLLAIEGRHDPRGVAALRAEWGSETAVNLGYAYRYLAGHLTDEQWERAKEIPVVTVPILRLLAEMGRAEVHSTPTATSPNRGSSPTMAETLTKADAEKRFRQLTADLHSAMARNDRVAVRTLDAERQLLSEALHPGTTESTEKRTV
jgi:hypothetical protein